MKVIVFISEDFYFLSHRKEILQQLKLYNIHSTIVTNVSDRVKEMENVGLPYVHFNLNRKSLSPLSVIKGGWSYAKIINQYTPDLIFAVALKPIVCILIARFFIRRKIPNLFAFAGLGVSFAENTKNFKLSISRYGMGFLFRMFLKRKRNYCLFQNDDDKKLFISKHWVSKRNSFIIPGVGVDINQFRPKYDASSKNLRFLFVGRLLFDKGIQYILDACKSLKKEGFKFTFNIAGIIDDTNPSCVSNDLMQEMHENGTIQWLGERKDIPTIMCSNDIFVFPSVYREGVPKVLLEASAAGLPMITTDTPGCRDIVKNEINGIIIKPYSLHNLITAMKYCIKNPEMLEKWGKISRQNALKEFSTETIIEKHRNLINTINGYEKIENKQL